MLFRSISLEDNLMRLFGSDRIAPLMDKLGLQEDEMIENSFITKRIDFCHNVRFTTQK